MRYRVERIGKDKLLTDNKQHVKDIISAYLDADSDIQLLICVGEHKEPGNKELKDG